MGCNTVKPCKQAIANPLKNCCHLTAVGVERVCAAETNEKRALTRFATAALVAGLLPLAGLLWTAGAMAQLAPAGTLIENKANGTYQDPNTGEIREVISNTVTVRVAEVAGITVTPAGLTEEDGSGDIEAGDRLFFDFTVTNVGNDPTKFRIPNSATVSGAGAIAGRLQISTDGGRTWTDIASSSAIGGYTFSDEQVETASFAPGESIRVRVPVTVAATAADGNVISVQLGQTPNSAQNVERAEDAGDVYTIDNPDGVAGESPGVPANGTREASAVQTATVGAPPVALAAIYKTHTEPVNAGNPADPTDDIITYNLALEVRSQTPAGSTGIVPGNFSNFTGSPITVNGNPVTRILVSDVVPSGTQLNGNWTFPNGWQVIFTKDDPATVNALSARWFSNPEDAAIGGLANVTRIGFIFDGTVNKGTTVSGLSFQVVTRGVVTSRAIANIAQVFGATEGAPTRLVYDESGDQLPNNFNDDGTPGPTDSADNPVIGTGIPDPAVQGTDDGNNNTGTGVGGEDNIVIIAAPSRGILNGPQGAPDAIGPTDNNDDFFNKSTPIAAGLNPTAPVDPVAVSFANTVQNTSSAAANITLLPVPPANPGDLPDGTRVTIAFGNQSATYTYTRSGGFATTQPPVVIPNVGVNQTANYSVEIDLPATAQLRGYPVPIAAFFDSNQNGAIDDGEPANTTIDRVYTGFVQILKESRLLKGTGADVQPGQDSFSSNSKTPSPGNIIEYRLTYTNISISGGRGSITLDASNIIITEDGTTYDATSNPSGNSWALDNDNRDGDGNPTTGIDTSNVPGSAADSRGGAIAFFSGRPATVQSSDKSGATVDSDVTKYLNTVRGTLGAGESGAFTFRRRVN